MYAAVKDQLASELDEIRAAGLFKAERVIGSPQQANVRVGGGEVLNLCANNYLGLADHPALIEAAQEALDRWGFGMASVRFICGTQEIHKELEARLSALPRHRGHDPLRLLLRCQRRSLRDAARAGGRGHLRRAQPRLDHRRDPAVQGPALPLRELRHGRAGSAPAGHVRGAPAADRHRRRVLDGRLRREARPDLRPRRALRRDGHGRRLARRRLRRRGRARHARAARA